MAARPKEHMSARQAHRIVPLSAVVLSRKPASSYFPWATPAGGSTHDDEQRVDRVACRVRTERGIDRVARRARTERGIDRVACRARTERGIDRVARRARAEQRAAAEAAAAATP